MKRFKAFNMETEQVEYACQHEWEMMGFLSDQHEQTLGQLMILDVESVIAFSAKEFKAVNRL